MFGSKQSVAKTSQKKQDDDEEDEEDIDVDELFKQVQADKGISVSQEDDVDSDVGGLSTRTRRERVAIRSVFLQLEADLEPCILVCCMTLRRRICAFALQSAL